MRGAGDNTRHCVEGASGGDDNCKVCGGDVVGRRGVVRVARGVLGEKVVEPANGLVKRFVVNGAILVEQGAWRVADV